MIASGIAVILVVGLINRPDTDESVMEYLDADIIETGGT